MQPAGVSKSLTRSEQVEIGDIPVARKYLKVRLREADIVVGSGFRPCVDLLRHGEGDDGKVGTMFPQKGIHARQRRDNRILGCKRRFGIRVLGPERIHGEIPIHGELDTQVLKPEPRGHQAKRAEPLEPPLRSRRKCTRSGHRRIIDESFGRNKSLYLCVLELCGAVDDRLLVDRHGWIRILPDGHPSLLRASVSLRPSPQNAQERSYHQGRTESAARSRVANSKTRSTTPRTPQH